jgi:hypothetical protein
MSLGVALARCNEWFVGPAFLVESFVSHPFRKERGKDGAPGGHRLEYLSNRDVSLIVAEATA